MIYTHLRNYLWVVAIAMCFVVGLSAYYEQQGHYKIQANIASGKSMQASIGEGSLVLWQRFYSNHTYNVGDIACYNSTFAASALNKSQYVVCHHVTAVANGTYKLVSDLMDCKEVPADPRSFRSRAEACNVTEDWVESKDMMGRVVVTNAWPYAAALPIGAAVLYGIYAVIFRKKDGKEEKPVRPMPA